MPAERLSMRNVREVLRLKHACGASVRTIARSVGVGHTTVAEYLRRTAVIGSPGRCRPRSTMPSWSGGVCPGRLQPAVGADYARLEPRPCRAAPAWRDPAVALGGLSRRADQPGRASGRLWIQPVLRSLHRLAPWRQRDDAPDPRGRREAVRGLRRRHRAGVRWGDRRGAARARVRRGAGRVELHLRRGALERGAGGLESARTSTRSPFWAARRSC